MQLRSSSDMVVLQQPPWWTLRRTAGALGAVAVVAVAALGWVATLRHQVRKKTDQIRERLRREAALEERYRRIVDTALEGILLLDSSGRISFVNQYMAEMLGYSMPKLTGRPLVDFVDPSYQKEARRFIAGKDSSRQRQFDLLLKHRDGSDVWTLAATNSFWDEQGQFMGTLAMLTNISERKIAEKKIRQLNEALEVRVQERTAELQSANRELEAFSYSVSHDLRAPLRAIEGFSDALLEDYASGFDDTAKMYLRRCRMATQEMNRLIEGLLSLAKVTRGELHREQVDLSALASSIVDGIRHSTQDRPVHFSLEPGLVDSVPKEMPRAGYRSRRWRVAIRRQPG